MDENDYKKILAKAIGQLIPGFKPATKLDNEEGHIIQESDIKDMTKVNQALAELIKGKLNTI